MTFVTNSLVIVGSELSTHHHCYVYCTFMNIILWTLSDAAVNDYHYTMSRGPGDIGM